MTTNFYPANLQWVGFAKEVTYGVAVTPPTIWVPVDGGSLKWKPDMAVLPDQAYRGLMASDYQQVQGMRSDTLAYKAYPYMDSVYSPHFLAAFGKPDTVTGSSDPWTHKTALYNGSGTDSAQPPSFTAYWHDASGKAQQTPGCMIDSLKITVAVDNLITLEPTWRGMPSTAVTAPVNTPSTNKPMPSWNALLTVGGAFAAARSIDITYSRNTEAVQTINNSQSPLAVGAFDLGVAGNLNAVFQGSQADVLLADFLANTQPVLTLKIAPAGDAVHSLTLQHSLVALDSAEPQGSAKWMEIQSAFKGLANATDALDSKQSPGQAIFLTSTSTAF